MAAAPPCPTSPLCAAALEEDASTVAPDDLGAGSRGSARSRHRRKIATHAKKEKEELDEKKEQSDTKNSGSGDCPSLMDLDIKVEALADIVIGLLRREEGHAQPPAGSSASVGKCVPVDGSAPAQKYVSIPIDELEGIRVRIARLEVKEEELAWLLYCKYKADKETYDELEKVKEDVKVLAGKVDYCIHEIDESDLGGDESEEEETGKRSGADDTSHDSGEFEEHEERHDERERDGTEAIRLGMEELLRSPVPEHIRTLPYLERMRALGFCKDKRP